MHTARRTYYIPIDMSSSSNPWGNLGGGGGQDLSGFAFHSVSKAGASSIAYGGVILPPLRSDNPAGTGPKPEPLEPKYMWYPVVRW